MRHSLELVTECMAYACESELPVGLYKQDLNPGNSRLWIFLNGYRKLVHLNKSFTLEIGGGTRNLSFYTVKV